MDSQRRIEIMKAVILGGSSGIGLAIGKCLIERGYFLEICSRTRPDDGILDERKYRFNYCDLLDFNENLFQSLSDDNQIDVLMISAGIGRVADFNSHHIAEIEKIITVNTLSIIKVLRIFYDRISSHECFYTGVMGSISGWLITPGAAVYSASKAALVRFIESVNIELEENKVDNRILDISPASFGGSKFYGGRNDLSITKPLAEQIIEHLFARNTRFIPEYEEKFKRILDEYHENYHEYGLYSYKYKKESDRFDNSRKVKIGYLSGTFDLFHVGHLNLLRRAKQNCDYLIVGVHDSGKWKGKETYIPLNERKEIVASCKYVDKVVDSCREDSDAWKLWHYDLLFVGSDYKGSERFKRYEEFFKDKSVKIVYFPYTQSTSSTQIRDAVRNSVYD